MSAEPSRLSLARAWTKEEVRTACEVCPEDWAATAGKGWGAIPWLWLIYIQRLCWTYGEAGALSRLNAPEACAA